MERKRFEPAQFYQKKRGRVCVLSFLLLAICRMRCNDAKARFFFLPAIPRCGDCFGVVSRIKTANKHEKEVTDFYNDAAG